MARLVFFIGVLEEDVFDMILRLTNEEATDIVMSLASTGGLWAHEVEVQIDDLRFPDAIEDIEETLETKLSRRPCMEDMRSKGIIKVRGSDPKFVATRSLSKKLIHRPTRSEVEKSGIVRETLPFKNLASAVEASLESRDVGDLKKRGILV